MVGWSETRRRQHATNSENKPKKGNNMMKVKLFLCSSDCCLSQSRIKNKHHGSFLVMMASLRDLFQDEAWATERLRKEFLSLTRRYRR
jgi:hypothetical protein